MELVKANLGDQAEARTDRTDVARASPGFLGQPTEEEEPTPKKPALSVARRSASGRGGRSRRSRPEATPTRRDRPVAAAMFPMGERANDREAAEGEREGEGGPTTVSVALRRFATRTAAPASGWRRRLPNGGRKSR